MNEEKKNITCIVDNNENNNIVKTGSLPILRVMDSVVYPSPKTISRHETSDEMIHQRKQRDSRRESMQLSPRHEMPLTPRAFLTIRKTRNENESAIVECFMEVEEIHYRLRIDGSVKLSYLLEAFQKAYIREHRLGPVTLGDGIYNKTAQEDLLLEKTVESSISLGDHLQLRPYTIAYDETKTIDGKALERAGMFCLDNLKAEFLVFNSKMLNISRTVLIANLHPYEYKAMTDPAVRMGTMLQWSKSSALRLRHVSINEKPRLRIEIQDIPAFGVQKMLAYATLQLDECMENCGITMTECVDLFSADNINTENTTAMGRLHLTIVFHPLVSCGRTIHDYKDAQRRLLRETQKTSLSLIKDGAMAPINAIKSAGKTSLSLVTGKETRETRRKRLSFKRRQQTASRSTTEQEKKDRRGVLHLRIRGIHLCDDKCLSSEGHNTLSENNETASIVLLFNFESYSDEVWLNSSSTMEFQYTNEWDVYSNYSQVQIEVIKLVASATFNNNVRRLKGGRMGVLIGKLKIPMLDILQTKASRWTRHPFKDNPDSLPIISHFQWYSIYQNEETEIGLAHIFADYHEIFTQIISSIRHDDCDHLDKEELQFDTAVIKRNVERLNACLELYDNLQLSMARIMQWEDPIISGMIWITLTLLLLYCPAEHFPLIPIAIFLVILSYSFIYFFKGKFHDELIFYTPVSNTRRIYRPLATLRLVPIGAAGLPNALYIAGSSGKLKSSTGSMRGACDYCVQVYYEPNFNGLSALLIGQTPVIRNSCNPVWGGNPHGIEYKMPNSSANNSWLRDMLNHLSSYDKDAVLRDVVEPWTRADGTIDKHSFKYPILQPVHMKASIDEEELTGWTEAPGFIRFDIISDRGSKSFIGENGVIGQVRIALKNMISNDLSGGEQTEIEKTYRIQLPSNNIVALKESPLASEPLRTNENLGLLTVRLQLTLPDPLQRTSLKDRLASEAIYEVMEKEQVKEMSLVEKLQKAKDVITTVQTDLSRFCNKMEKLKNLFLWAHPWKTLKLYLFLWVGLLVAYYIPARYIITAILAKKFTKRIHQMQDTDMIRFNNLLSSIPSDVDLKKVFYQKNLHFCRMKENEDAQVKLQAMWSGNIWKYGESIFKGWKNRYSVIRNGRLDYWRHARDAKSGVPPKGSILLSSKTEQYHKSERVHAPKNSFILAVFDMSRRGYMSPRGKRRLIAFPTQQSLQSFVEAVKKLEIKS